MCEHKKEHQKYSRRNFLKKTTILSASSFLFSQFPIYALAENPIQGFSNKHDNILVLFQLKGGNDGLNTIVPFYDYGYYKSQRPKLHVEKSDLFFFDKNYAAPKTISPLKKLWDKGMMKVIHNVGYPDANLSHFHSSDIWSTANNKNTKINTGWLGRFNSSKKTETDFPPAIQIGGDAELLLQGNQGNASFSLESIEELPDIEQETSTITESFHSSNYHDEINFIHSISNATIQYAKQIKLAEQRGKTQAHYNNDSLSQQLKLAAKLIKGNLQTQTYLITLDGFDTHAHQAWKHQELLKQLSNAIFSFYADLSASKLQDKVLTMTYSEFGRRIEENGSMGTDHGTAAPMLFFGGALGGNGFIGEPPNLRQPDENGNLKYEIDFRSVYTTLLDNWMGATPQQIKMSIPGQHKKIQGLI